MHILVLFTSGKIAYPFTSGGVLCKFDFSPELNSIRGWDLNPRVGLDRFSSSGECSSNVRAQEGLLP